MDVRSAVIQRRISLIVAALAVVASVAGPAATSPFGARETAPAAARSATQTVDDLFAEPGLHRGHSIVLRLYWAALNRKPELGGAEFWINTYDAGQWDVRRIAAHFVVSQEYQDLYGELDNAEFVTVVYNNMLGRNPEPSGFDFWTDQLDRGMSRAEMILLVSNDTEFVNRRPPLSDARPNTGHRFSQPITRTEALAILDRFRFGGTLPPNCAGYYGHGVADAALRFACRGAGTSLDASVMIILANRRQVHTLDGSTYRDAIQAQIPSDLTVLRVLPDEKALTFADSRQPGSELVTVNWDVEVLSGSRGDRTDWPAHTDLRWTGAGFELVRAYDGSGDL